MKVDFEKAIKDGVEQAMRECELTIGITLREAVEKQIPMKLDYEGDGYDESGNLIYDIAHCRVCGCEFEYEINDWGCSYCSSCGQRLDWRADNGT